MSNVTIKIYNGKPAFAKSYTFIVKRVIAAERVVEK